jgi:UDP-hydrolysing UDP-N-acetyl-D-glucosamine 2-epimerase
MIGDRYEALSATIAAAYLNLCIVHLQGGEVSGSIDESARHAISKFAHFHVPSTRRSMEYLIRMGEDPKTILEVGCPSSDIAKNLDVKVTSDMINTKGSGAWIDVEKPYLLAVYHPTTTAFGQERREMQALLRALDRVRVQTLLLWPNIDAGADRISKEIRLFRDQVGPTWLRTITNSPPDEYLRLLGSAQCAVGNSSSFVRDAGFFGTPVVLVGDRQLGRERDVHVVAVEPEFEAIAGALEDQIAHGRYEASTLYGDGGVARRIAASLAEIEPYVQKSLFYVNESGPLPPAQEGVRRPAGVGGSR